MNYKKITNLFLITLTLFTLSCGFKVLDNTKANNFSIVNLITTGDKRINYKIKNQLALYSKTDSQNQLIIYLDSKKLKSIKEKNIKNEITKYQINLTVNIRFYAENEAENINNINLNIGGNYSVDLIHSKTISNEKKLVESLIEKISDKIVNEIALRINDN